MMRTVGRLKALLPFAAMLASSIAAAPPAAPPGTIQSYDTYKSWYVACDNTLDCVAKGFADTYQGAEIKIERSAGAAGALTATLSATRKLRLADIRIDGKPVGLAAPAWHIEGTSDASSAISSDPVAIRALVQRLRDASSVSFGGDTDVPLDGFAAAILRLDDRQGRIGGVTALARPGPLPAARVPAAPSLPRIVRRPITATLAPGEEKRLIATVRTGQKAVFAKEDCEANPNAMEPEADALDARHALVLIPCLMGAYQGSSLGFIVPRGGGPAVRLIAPMPYLGNDRDRSDADMFTESDFDAKTGTLSMSAKGRGLADCGVSASWTWNGSGFVLTELAMQQACGGIEPGDWPTLFRSAH